MLEMRCERNVMYPVFSVFDKNPTMGYHKGE